MVQMENRQQWIGLDIGGANIKLACGTSAIREIPFPLWKHPRRLSRKLAELLSDFDNRLPVAASMTGELADCFATREQGVTVIARCLAAAANGRSIRWFSLNGSWDTTDQVLADPSAYAASNWLALATYVAKLLGDGDAILLDIGTTTTDIIPIRSGHAVPRGRTDTERLLSGELLYLGVARTPLCAVLSYAPYRGQQISTAAELFATTLDVFLMLGELPESMQCDYTADGRAATKAAAERRLARTILAIGAHEFNTEDAVVLAEEARRQLILRIGTALQTVADRSGIDLANTVCTGRGSFLGRCVLGSLGIETGSQAVVARELADVENCGAARALAWLAQRDACLSDEGASP